MGWTYYWASEYKNGKIDRKAECDKYFTYENSPYEVLKSSMVGTTYYGAIKRGEEVFAVVFLTSVDGYDFGYKDMDETVLPYQFDCPKSILNLLTPTDNVNANEWRRICRENIEKKKTKVTLTKLPVGTRIQFEMPFDTTYFSKGDQVILEKRKRAKSTCWANNWCYFTRPLMKRIEENCEWKVVE